MKKEKIIIIKTVNRNLLVSFFLILFSSSAFGQYKQAGSWISAEAELSFLKDFKAKVETGYRIINNFQTTDKLYVEGGIEYGINKYLDVSGEYRFFKKYIYDNDFNADRHRIMFKFQAGYKESDLQFVWTGKYQMNFFDPKEHDWNNLKSTTQLRNRFQIKYQRKKAKFIPYAYYEMFVPLDTRDQYYLMPVNYRLSGGTEVKINKKNSVKFYFLFEREFDEIIEYQSYIYGLSYTIKIH